MATSKVLVFSLALGAVVLLGAGFGCSGGGYTYRAYGTDGDYYYGDGGYPHDTYHYYNRDGYRHHRGYNFDRDGSRHGYDRDRGEFRGRSQGTHSGQYQGGRHRAHPGQSHGARQGGHR